jgi:hypothetical protein
MLEDVPAAVAGVAATARATAARLPAHVPSELFAAGTAHHTS